MKPLEKYQEKFTALLKEAEEELGGPLSVKISSREKDVFNTAATGYPLANGKEYKCSISIGDAWL